MEKKYQNSLFIFRRDLRLHDNTALIQALEQSEAVIPCFIFDPRQVSTKNQYRSLNALQFMVESVQDLDAQLREQHGKLFIFHGEPVKVLAALIKQISIDAIFCNRDYTPFSIERDNSIKHLCNQHHINFHQMGDALINEPESIKSASGTPYTIFTPFFKKSRTVSVSHPADNRSTNFYTKIIKGSESQAIYKKVISANNKYLHVSGGRTEGIKLLKKTTLLDDYAATHDYPAEQTSNLAPYLKFGTISIGEAYQTIANKLGSGHPLLRQLYWRDFFTHADQIYPEVTLLRK